MAAVMGANEANFGVSTAHEGVMLVRRLSEEDLGVWSELLAICFSRTSEDMAALLRWMIDGWGLVAYGVWLDGRLVAQYSCLHARLSMPSLPEPLSVGMSVNMATHPDYRGKGLIKHAAAPVYDVLKAQGTIAGVGFSNAAGVKVDRHSKGYGYQVIGKLRSWVALPLMRRKPVGDFYLTTQLPSMDGLVSAASGLHFDVTSAEIARRFGQHPFRQYHYGLWMQDNSCLGVVIYQETRICGVRAVSLLGAYGQDIEGILARWLACLPVGVVIHMLSTPTSAIRSALGRLTHIVQLPWQKSPYYLTVKRLSDQTPTDLFDFAAWDCLGGHIL